MNVFQPFGAGVPNVAKIHATRLMRWIAQKETCKANSVRTSVSFKITLIQSFATGIDFWNQDTTILKILKASHVNAAERNRNSCNPHHAVYHSTSDGVGLN